MEPWNIKGDDIRKSDFLPTFIIFCEDGVSEPLYFKYFETPLIKVNPIGRQRSKVDHVIKAITHCISEDLMEYENGRAILKAEETQVWCVFDRDLEAQEKHRPAGDTAFNQGIEIAKSGGLKVAWSNDSFELWVLLHFQDVDPSDEENWSRNTYYEKLTEIFRALDGPNSDLARALAYPKFSYKTNLKQESNFRNIVRAEIVSKTKEAIMRAKYLEKYHEQENKPNHKKVPCTLVYRLVEELIRLGGKNFDGVDSSKIDPAD